MHLEVLDDIITCKHLWETLAFVIGHIKFHRARELELLYTAKSVVAKNLLGILINIQVEIMSVSGDSET